MSRLLPFACLSLMLTSAPALAQAPAGSADAAASPVSVEEILKHLETFMPEPNQASPALYVLGPELDRETVGSGPLRIPSKTPPGEDEVEEGEVVQEASGEEDARPETEPAPDTTEDDDPDAQALEAQLGAIDFETLSRDVQILPMIGKDMAEIDPGFRASALHDMARRAIDSGQPGAFRKIMAAYVDSNWQSLSDAETALNIIAWMPDTAAFLGARISAARFVGAQGALSPEDQAFLWKDLRARVVRVGREDYMQDMLRGMIETGSTTLAIDTIKRSTASEHERMAAYLQLIERDGSSMTPEALSEISAEVDALRGELQSTRYDPNAVALAYWHSGLTDQALEALSEETDPALRLRTHFEMLLDAK